MLNAVQSREGSVFADGAEPWGPQQAPSQILNPVQHRLDLFERFGLISPSKKESSDSNGT